MLNLGCQTFGPNDFDSIPGYMAKTLPESDNKPIISGPGIWEADMRGFLTLKEAYSKTKGSSWTGVGGIAITDLAIYYGEWQSNEQRYTLGRRLFLNDLQDVIFETFGNNVCLAVQKKDLSWHTITFSGKQLVDKIKTKEAYVFIKSKIK